MANTVNWYESTDIFDMVTQIAAYTRPLTIINERKTRLWTTAVLGWSVGDIVNVRSIHKETVRGKEHVFIRLADRGSDSDMRSCYDMWNYYIEDTTAACHYLRDIVGGVGVYEKDHLLLPTLPQCQLVPLTDKTMICWTHLGTTLQQTALDKPMCPKSRQWFEYYVQKHETIVSLAEQAYAEVINKKTTILKQAPLLVLADALEEVASQYIHIIQHLRNGQPHVQGCWALDTILGV